MKKMSLDPSDYTNEEYEEDEFVPHERIFSKYSVMLYYSQDAGKNFYIHQDCRYCESCHEKVRQTVSSTLMMRINGIQIFRV